LASLPLEDTVKGAIRIRLKTTNGMKLAQLNIEQLTFHLAGSDDTASKLYELSFGHALGIVGCESKRPAKWVEFLSPDALKPEGFDADQSMLPYQVRAFQGYRLLHEYFAFPSRYHFFTLHGLKKILARSEGETLDLTILLDCPVGELENRGRQKTVGIVLYAGDQSVSETRGSGSGWRAES